MPVYLERLLEEVSAHEKIQVLTEALVVGFTGYKGNFSMEVLVGYGMYQRKIEHGVAIVATGARKYPSQRNFATARIVGS